MTYSERLYQNYGQKGYITDDLKHVRPGPDTKTVNFGRLWDILRSPDEKLLEEEKWIFEDPKDDKFLNENSERTVETMN